MEEDYVPQEIEISARQYSTAKKTRPTSEKEKRRKDKRIMETYSPEPDEVDQQLEIQDTLIQQFQVELLESAEDSQQHILYYQDNLNQFVNTGSKQYESVKEVEVVQEIEGAEYATLEKAHGYQTQQSIEEETHLQVIEQKIPLLIASNRFKVSFDDENEFARKVIQHHTLKLRGTRSHSILPQTSQGLLLTNDSGHRNSVVFTEQQPISDISPLHRQEAMSPNMNYQLVCTKIEACFYEDQETKHSEQKIIFVSLFQLKQTHSFFGILSNGMARLLLSSGMIQKQSSKEPLYIQGQEQEQFTISSNQVYLVLTGTAIIMNEGHQLGCVKEGGCVGQECVIHQNLGKAPSKRVADTCYLQNDQKQSYVLVLNQKALKRFREHGFLIGGRKDIQLFEKMLLHNLRQKKSWRKKKMQDKQ